MVVEKRDLWNKFREKEGIGGTLVEMYLANYE